MSVEGMAVSFKYDYNGLRTQKIVEADWYPVTTNYILHGKLITHMTVDYTDWDEVDQQDVLHFFYDAQSRPAMVEFNGELYTYVHNLQGDIVAILDSLGNLMVEYKYDAWGKPISTTGWMADTLGARNPFRYRGYVYDEETGLYYLRNRYYNPEIGRFENADTQLNPRGFGANQFAYCGNNPSNRIDSSGNAWYNDVWNWTTNAANDAWNWTTNAANDAWNWTTNAATDAWNWTANAATDAWNWTTNAATDAWNWTTKAATDAWNWVTKAATDAWKWITKAATDAWKWVRKAASDAGEFIKKIVTNNIVKGAATMIGGLTAVVIGVAGLLSPEPVVSKAAGTKAIVVGVAEIVGGVAGIIAGLGDILS